jgi:flagellar assembly factor FliW
MLSEDYAGEFKGTVASEATTPVAGLVRDQDLEEQELLFPVGILGFPAAQRYRLERVHPEDGTNSPFFTLSCIDQSLSFAVIQPHHLHLEYRLTIDAQILETLRATSSDQVSVLLIVTLREPLDDISVNLQGPLVVNPTSAMAVQLVAEEYPLRYPLLRKAR